MNCPHCGSPAPAGSRFCNMCSKPLVAPGAPAAASPPGGDRTIQYAERPPDAPSTPTVSQKKPILLIGLLALLLLGGGAGVWMALQPRKSGDSVIAIAPAVAPQGPSVQEAVVPEPAPAPPVTGADSAPAVNPAPPADHTDLQKYIEWLKFVEKERQGLRAQAETESFRAIERFLGAMGAHADADFKDGQFEEQHKATLDNTLRAIDLFRQNIARTKPPVPADCQTLDGFYMAAVNQEAQDTANLLQAMVRKDIGGVRNIGKQSVASIEGNLKQAGGELEKVHQARGLRQEFRIETGGGGSMLGGLTGMGGLGGLR